MKKFSVQFAHKEKRGARNLAQLQREQLSAIGATLQQTRQESGLLLADLASKTMIRASLLASIESADLENLPEPIYVRGIIKRYGDALGVDGEALALQFFTHHSVKDKPQSWRDNPAAQLRPLHLYALYLLVMVAAVSGLSHVLRQTAPDAAMLPPLNPLAQSGEEPAAASPTQGDVITSSDQTSATQSRPIEVEIRLTAQSWMRVMVDGEMEFEGMLQQGDARTWAADESVVLRAGNAGGVVVTYNGEQATPLGAPGTVAEVTFPPEPSSQAIWGQGVRLTQLP